MPPTHASSPATRDAGRPGDDPLWSGVIAQRRALVAHTGLRIWCVSLCLLNGGLWLLIASRRSYASVVPIGVVSALAIVATAVALGFALRTPARNLDIGEVAAAGGGVTLLAAVAFSATAAQPGYASDAIHNALTILMVGFAMLLPIPSRVGIPILAAIAIAYPTVLLVVGVGDPGDLSFVLQLADVAGGFGLSVIVLVLHDLLFASRSRALHDLARLAEHDGLTGALNRRTFVDRLVRESSRAARYQRRVGLIIYDIDQFKRFNTRHGYAAGDRMLKELARTLGGMLRLQSFAGCGGSVARYGGEEFVVLLPDATEELIERFAEESRAAIASRRIVIADQVLGLTVSVGTQISTPDVQLKPGQLLAAADKALYSAKTKGGDAVVAGTATEAPNDVTNPRYLTREIMLPRADASRSAPDGDVDAVHMHGVILRWLIAIAALWVMLFGLADIALRLGPMPDLDVRVTLGARAAVALVLLGVLTISPRRPSWRRSTLVHAALVLSLSALVVATMLRTGGIESPYYSGLVYLVVGWALAFSAPTIVSVVVVFGVAVCLPVYYVGAEGLSPFDPALVVRTGVLAAAGIIALATQSIFARLRAEEYTAREQLDHLARIDPLTGLPNRVAFDRRLELHIARARAGTALSLVMFDLDHFKALNDTHGHLVGDEALARTGTAIEETIRIPDVPGRMGGEEFAIALPHTDASGAALVAERLRQRLRAVTVKDGAARLAASFGVAGWREGDTVSSLLARADEALRRAKIEGRNRVVVHLDDEAAR